MRDVLPTLERWARDGVRAALATVVGVDRSAPREPGSVMAVSETGEVVGSVTGGCVEPAVYLHAEEVLAGGPARMATYGIVDEEAFEVGLPCGGNVSIFVEPMDPAAVMRGRGRRARGAARGLPHDGRRGAAGRAARDLPRGRRRPTTSRPPPAPLLTLGESGVVEVGGHEVFVSSFVPRPAMYVFGAIDFASSLATVGRFLGYRVTVCDPRAIFVTPERFPDADELVIEWPHEFLARAPVDERTAICVLTHDDKFDVPALRAALATPAALHRGDGIAPHHRAASRAPAGARGGRGGARPHPRPHRPVDRVAHPGGGRGRHRRADRRRGEPRRRPRPDMSRPAAGPHRSRDRS